MTTKKAAVLTAATERKSVTRRAYQTAAPLSRTKCRLLVEIRGLAGALLSPFCPAEEKATAEVLFRSTLRKLSVLQNGRCSGPVYAGATNAGQRVS